MENNYFRITGHYPKEDFCFIIDCYGMFEKLWQFSVYVRDKGITVLEVSKDGVFLDGNMDRAEYDKEKVILRATEKGKPDYVPYEMDGVTYKAIKVGACIYVPDRAIVM